MTPLPEWPKGTVAILGTVTGAIPVSTVVRLSDDALAFGLSTKRDSLAAIHMDPKVHVAILCEEVAVTAHGTATVVDPLPGVDGMVGVVVAVDRLQDHDSRRFRIDGGVSWHWTDDESALRDEDVRAAVASLEP